METTERNQIIEKFVTLFKESELKNREAAERIGFHENYIVWVKNEKSWGKINPKTIAAINDFLLSGKKLSEYHCSPKDKKAPSEEKVGAAAATKPEPEKKKKPESNAAIQDRLARDLIKVMEEAGMNNIEAGRLLGVTPESLALVRNDRYRINCPANVWAAIKKFLQSGKPLKEYHYLAPEVGIKTKETLINSAEGHKFILDIEINLTLNGRRIEV